MNIRRIITGCTLCAACIANIYAGDINGFNEITGVRDTGSRLHGEVYSEMNYGYNFEGADRNRWDFPHIVASAVLDMGRGWTLSAELEYERMYEDGEWCDDHSDNFATNRFYLNKQWNDRFGLKIGIVDVPLGVTNAGGPALTVYDPLSEAALMPMTWHEAGVAVHGTLGGTTIDYMLAALVCGDLPLEDCRAVGVATAVGWQPFSGMRLSVGGFCGNTSRGMLRHGAPDCIDASFLSYGVAGACYEHAGWVASGSFIHCTDGDVRSVGVEAGYNVLSSVGDGRWGLTPFVRYDGVFHCPGGDVDKFTIGLNAALPGNFIVKAEAGRCGYGSYGTVNTLDVRVGYTFVF